MNVYPSWIHRIPEMIEALALAAHERIDRHTVEQLFDLRKTAAFHLLRPYGRRTRRPFSRHKPHLIDGALTGGTGASAMALGKGAPNWHPRAHRPTASAARSKSLVPVDAALRQAMETAEIAGLPATIRLSPGLLSIRCADMPDLLRQLVLLAQAADRNYEDLRTRIELPIRRHPASADSLSRPEKSAHSV